MLTGKAKEDFDKWLFYERFNQQQITFSYFQKLDQNLQKALIVEWLDSLQHEGLRYFSQVFEKSFAIRISYMSFNDVVDQSIKICNDYYNNIKR